MWSLEAPAKSCSVQHAQQIVAAIMDGLHAGALQHAVCYSVQDDQDKNLKDSVQLPDGTVRIPQSSHGGAARGSGGAARGLLGVPEAELDSPV